MAKSKDDLIAALSTIFNSSVSSSSTTPTPSLIPDESVLKITASGVEYSSRRPHVTPCYGTWGGTGFVIEGNRIVTNAHVGDAHFIEVKFSKGDPNSYRAKIEKLGQDCDLAVLTVANKEFWKKAQPLTISNTDPSMNDSISVHGFPIGGKNLCITHGFVSRTEKLHYYAHSGVQLPIAQITAAINPGNSGGPVTRNGEVVGVAFQGLRGVEGGGQIIPATTLRHFLLDEPRETQRGFPGLSFSWQSLSPLQRENYWMSDEQTGIRIIQVDKLSAAYQILEPDDILLSIEGKVIQDDGNIEFEDGSYENFMVLIHQKFIGDKLKMTVLRQGYEQNIEIELCNHIGSTKLLQPRSDSQQETFFWHSGMLFQVLSLNLLNESTGLMGLLMGGMLPDQLMKLKSAYKNHEDHQAIILNTSIPCISTKQAKNYHMHHVAAINGYKISCIKDAIAALIMNQNASHVIQVSGGKVLQIKNLSNNKQKKLLRKFGILTDRSEDLIDIEANLPAIANLNFLVRKNIDTIDNDCCSDEDFVETSKYNLNAAMIFSDVYAQYGANRNVLADLEHQVSASSSASTSKRKNCADDVQLMPSESQFKRARRY